MTALIIILCIVAFFALLFSIPAHVVIEANSDVRVYARVLFIKYALFPMKKRKKKTKTAKKSKKTAKILLQRGEICENVLHYGQIRGIIV